MKFFRIHEAGSTLKRELLAGATIFASMAYVTFINPTILGAAGINFGAALVATILVTCVSCLLMGLLANYPFCIAPGIGVSAYLAYAVVLNVGFSWQAALAANLIASAAIFLLALFHIRRKILMSIPHTLLQGISCGVGLFLIAVALKNIGLIVSDHDALIHFGRGELAPILFTAGSLLALYLFSRWKVHSAFLWVILANWALGIAFGFSTWKGIFALPPSLKPTLLQLDFSTALNPHTLAIILSIFLVALFDSTAGLMILAKQGKFLQEGKLPRMQRALLPDAITSLTCPLLGTGTLAVHIESLAGIQIGGRTGLTSVVCALLFLVCLFLYPLISSIPLFATAPILIALGAGMCREARHVAWKSPSDLIPFLIATLTMPLTFSIYKGFTYGFISYALCKLLFGKWREIPLSCIIFSILFAAQVIYDVLF